MTRPESTWGVAYRLSTGAPHWRTMLEASDQVYRHGLAHTIACTAETSSGFTTGGRLGAEDQYRQVAHQEFRTRRLETSAIAADKESLNTPFTIIASYSEDEVKAIAAGSLKVTSSSRCVSFLPAESSDTCLNGDVRGERNFGFTFHSVHQRKGYAAEAAPGNQLCIRCNGCGETDQWHGECESLVSQIAGQTGFHKTGETVGSFGRTGKDGPLSSPAHRSHSGKLSGRTDYARL